MSYKAKVTYTSTAAATPLFLVSAWYDSSGNLKEIYTSNITTTAGSTQTSGQVVNSVFTATTGKTVSALTDFTGLTMKVMLWDGTSVIKPLIAPYVISGT